MTFPIVQLKIYYRSLMISQYFFRTLIQHGYLVEQINQLYFIGSVPTDCL